MSRLRTKAIVALAALSLLILSVFEIADQGGPPSDWRHGWRDLPEHGELALSSLMSLEAEYHYKLNATLMRKAKDYVQFIQNPSDDRFPQMRCPTTNEGRYKSLTKHGSPQPTYLFAINLHQNAEITPRLLRSILQAMHLLVEQNCALSIVEGRSDDGTLEILIELEATMKERGILYYVQSSKINPLYDRIRSLAELRNLALDPYTPSLTSFASDATIIFINDIVLCANDILELVYQRHVQNADMTCGMDWTYVGEHPTFYDVWIARSMSGDTFFHVPQDGSWDFAWNLFWDNPESLARYVSGQPFQVFSCWNGVTAFTAKPVLEKTIRFRESRPEECLQGEPKLFSKDMWLNGYGRIAVVPSVNVEYSNAAGAKIKNEKGYVAKWLENEDENYRIMWQREPPRLVKCMPGYDQQKMVAWNEGFQA